MTGAVLQTAARGRIRKGAVTAKAGDRKRPAEVGLGKATMQDRYRKLGVLRRFALVRGSRSQACSTKTGPAGLGLIMEIPGSWDGTIRVMDVGAMYFWHLHIPNAISDACFLTRSPLT